MNLIKTHYQSSILKKVLVFLFSEQNSIKIEGSFFLKKLSGLENQRIAEILLFSSLVFLWYENLLVKFIPFLGNIFIVPLLLLLSFIFCSKKTLSLHKPQLYYLLFLISLLFSALLGAFRGLDLIILFAGWFILLQVFIVLLVSQSLKDKLSFLKGMIFLSLPLSFFGIYQYLLKTETPLEWISASENITTRAFAFFGSPNILGALSVVIIFLTGAIYLKEKKKLYLFIGIINLFVLFVTFSRSSWLAFFAGLLLFAFLKNTKTFLISALFTPLVFLYAPIRDRIMISFSPNYLNDSMLDGRLWSISNGLYLFEKYFYFGSGPGTYGGLTALKHASPVYLEGMQRGYTALYFTDNQWIQILVTGGLVGSVLFALFFVSSLNLILINFKRKNDIIHLAGASILLSFFVLGMFGNVLEFGAVSIPTAIILGFVLGNGQKLKE